MAALFCPRATTACLRAVPRVSSPIIARATFSQQTTRTLRTQRESTSISQLVKGMRSMNMAARPSTRCFSSGQPRRDATTTTPPTSAPDTHLTWDRFFTLRRNRRYINAGCSLITAAASVILLTPILADQDFDAWAAQISGLDPIIVMGISTFGIAALGWLLGPTVGNTGFRIWAGRKGWNGQIAAKEKSFYARIKKYRADASSSSPQNPIPDYYGEKVKSVRDYRRWLKDQRAFNLKKNKNMI